MSKGALLSGMKGQGSGVAVAFIVIIVIALVVLLAFPNVLGGFNFFGGGGSAPIGVGPGSAGVVINSFQITPPTIEGGDVATFTVEVQNKGGIDAESITYDIFGLSDSNSWSGKTTTQSGASTLEHEDLARGIPGESTVQEWESTSKEKNTDITYPVTARVDYKYRTETDVVLLLYGRDNPNVKNTGITQSTISQVVTTIGPLSVAPKGTIPLIGSNTDDFRISFEVTNSGGGRTYIGSKDTGLDKIKVSTTGCTLTGQSEVKLISGKRTISCKVDTSIKTDGQETKSVNLKLEYNYIVESTGNVQVLKQVDQS